MPAGRPPKYETPEQMQEAIEAYFNDVPKRTVYHDGQPIEIPVVTITGLTLALGFCDRASFYDYEKKEEFTHTIKRARLMVENDYEMQLRTSASGQAGTIFGLKNLGWKDKTEVDNTHSGPNGGPIETNVWNLTPVASKPKGAD